LIPGPVWLALKTLIFLFLFVFVRAALPRYRYDRLMVLGWKVLLPISLAWFLFTLPRCIVLNYFNFQLAKAPLKDDLVVQNESQFANLDEIWQRPKGLRFILLLGSGLWNPRHGS
jgi:hypothetical protein